MIYSVYMRRLKFTYGHSNTDTEKNDLYTRIYIYTVRYGTYIYGTVRMYTAYIYLYGSGQPYIYGFFGWEITKYTVIYGVYIRCWPTLHIQQEGVAGVCGGQTV